MHHYKAPELRLRDFTFKFSLIPSSFFPRPFPLLHPIFFNILCPYEASSAMQMPLLEKHTTSQYCTDTKKKKVISQILITAYKYQLGICSWLTPNY